MQGLLLAEVGESMVQRSIDGSGFLEGQRIVPGLVTPGGGGLASRPAAGSVSGPSLSRHGTLLSVGVLPAKNAAELKLLLGNGNARLKPGASLHPPHQPTESVLASKNVDTVALEQAKPRARVAIDIILESDTCVQGSYLRGHVKVRIQRSSRNESPILIAEGKVRVVGFESIPNADDRHTFYQCSAPLSAITADSETMYAAGPDEEGFWEAKEGIHVLEFAFPLSVEGTEGNAKGAINIHSGVSVRYIAMA
jgi:hypothetical protein